MLTRVCAAASGRPPTFRSPFSLPFQFLYTQHTNQYVLALHSDARMLPEVQVY